ncbi:Hypothetical protein PHPALM_14280 [Phytophthora palmivora]|uniref:Uncharacterized protein n=1 Tax=Phytophthora palmivora TaxID=4796 RepID=A0A2P4XV51_9STRA|nr:Hypothetical protein PHPALM_14280 [Phytophthora palmivora]
MGFIAGNESQNCRPLRAGQLERRLFITGLHLLELWLEVFICPIGVVEKAGGAQGDIRLINEFSFPEGISVNDYTYRGNFPPVSYNPPQNIAIRIHMLK